MSLVLASFAVVMTNPTALERKKTLACNKSLNLVLTNLSSNESSSSNKVYYVDRWFRTTQTQRECVHSQKIVDIPIRVVKKVITKNGRELDIA